LSILTNKTNSPILVSKGAVMENNCLDWLAQSKGEVCNLNVGEVEDFIDFLINYKNNRSPQPIAYQSYFMKQKREWKCQKHERLSLSFHCGLEDARINIYSIKKVAGELGIIEPIIEETPPPPKVIPVMDLDQWDYIYT